MITITILGEPGTGKTSLKNYLLGQEFDESQAMTLGANFNFTSLNNIKLRICDIAGQSSYQIVRKNYMKRSDGALLVFDLTNPDSFHKLSEWTNAYTSMNSSKTIPILIVGNKSDLQENRKVMLEDVEIYQRRLENHPILKYNIVGYLETSAKTGDNVSKAFSQVAKIINDQIIISG